MKEYRKECKLFPNDIINKCAYYDFFKNILQTLCSNKLSLDKSNFNYSKESMLVLRESCFSKNLLTQKRDIISMCFLTQEQMKLKKKIKLNLVYSFYIGI